MKRTLFLIMLVTPFLSSGKAHENEALKTIIGKDKIGTIHSVEFPKPILSLSALINSMEPGIFYTIYSGDALPSYTYYDGVKYYLKDVTPNCAPIDVMDSYKNVFSNNSASWDFRPDTVKMAALDVYLGLQKIRDSLRVKHGIHGYDKDNVNPAKPYSC